MRLCAAIAVVLGAAPASADECGPCTCVGELRAIQRSEAPRDVALNARFRAGKPISTPELSRRLALRRSGGGEVPHEQRELNVDGHAQVELVPRGPLQKDTEYEVVQWTGEHSLVVASFRTSDGEDATPPRWAGIRAAAYRPADSCSVACSSRRGARVEVETEPPEDDRSGAELVAVWLASGEEAIDYRRAPVGYLTARQSRYELGATLDLAPRLKLELGGAGPCVDGTLPLPRGARRLRIGMRAVDRAGNLGAPSEATVEIPGTAKRPKR